jgi:hypothetical protein
MTAFFVLATTLLIVDMVRRIRRVRYRAQVEEERMAAAMAAAEQDMLEVPGTGDAATQPAGTQASDTQPAGTQASGTQGGAESRTEPDGDEGRGRS